MTLALTPETCDIRHYMEGESVPLNCIEVTFVEDCVAFFGGNVPARVFLAPAVTEKMLGPLWCITETNDKEEANMICSTVVIQVMVQSELVSGDDAIVSRIRKVYEEKPITVALRIPVLLNTKTLVRGDVLRVFAKKTTQKREEKPSRSRLRKLRKRQSLQQSADGFRPC